MKIATSIQDIKSTPFFSQFTDEQIRAQIKKSLEGIETMKARAIKTGKKVGGFTIPELQTMIDQYKTILGGNQTYHRVGVRIKPPTFLMDIKTQTPYTKGAKRTLK